MKLSVIVPIYNAEKYLRECLDSLTKQDWNDIEFILIDDGAQDSSGRICDEYAENDRRFIVVHQKNGGSSCARNVGLEIAQGDYIGFVDADDVIRKDMYQILCSLAIQYKADIAECNVVSGWDGKTISASTEDARVSSEEGTEILKKYFSENKVSVWCRIYKKELFNTVKFEIGNPAEDVIMNYRLFEQAERVVYTTERLYYYRMVPNSLSKKVRHVVGFQSERVADLVKYEHPEVYPFAKMQTYQSALNLFSAEIANPYTDKDDIAKFDRIKKQYCNEIRENIFSIIQSPGFTKGAKIQLLLIAVHYRVYRCLKKFVLWNTRRKHL